MGALILRVERDRLPRLVGWSLVATLALTVPVAGTLSKIEGGRIGEPSL